jgi:hypothetical protein
MNESVKIGVIKQENVDISDLEPFQGQLKKLSGENYNKLRDSIINDGFSFMIHVWANGGINYIIDGHQRVSVLTQMRKQGIEVPKIPCAFVDAKNYREAKKLVLLAISQYGKIDTEGFNSFVAGENFELNDFDFPDFEVDNLDLGNSDDVIKNPKEIDSPLETENTCPKCGYEYD